MIELAVFWLFALLALTFGIVVVTHRNPVYATLSLVVTLFSTAVLFVLLAAPFVAVLQILLYAGAILVLFLFVIMLLNVQRERQSHAAISAQSWAAAIAALIFAGGLASLLWDAHGADTAPPVTASLISLKALARQLFQEYLLPFEIIGLLLLIAVVAATVVARRANEGAEGEQPWQR